MFVPMIAAALTLAAPMQTQQTDTTFAVSRNGRLELENQRGSVTVRGWDRQEIRVRARHPDRTRIRIADRGSVVHVEADARYGPPDGVTYEIDVPKSFSVALEGVDLVVDIQDVGAGVEVETVNGAIRLRGGSGRVNLESTQGEIIIEGTTGRINAETVNQAVRITNAAGDINAGTVNGPIVLKGIRANSVEASTVNGSVSYEGVISSGGRYHLSTHNGQVDVAVPENTNATVSIATYNGRFETDFPVQIRNVRPGQRTTFTLGNGSARLELESFGGSIHLRRPGRD